MAAALPWLVAGLPAGALADRLDRRRLMFSIEIFRATVLVLLAVVVLIGRQSLPLLYLTVFALGLGQTAFSAAASVELPRLVPDEQLGRANGYLLAAETASEQTIGPAVGGVLFGVAIAAPLITDGISFLVSAALIAVAIPRRVEATPRPVPSSPPVPPPLPPSMSPSVSPSLSAVRSTLRAEVRDGWRHFRADQLLMLLAGVIAILAFCQAMVLSTLVLSALRTFGLGSAGYGLLLGCTSIGSIVGGVAAGRVDRRCGPALTLSLAALVAGGGYALIGFTTSGVVAGVGLAVEAIAVMLGNVSSMTLRQRRVPGHLLGRVGNIIRWCIFGVVPLGAISGGVLAEQVSLRAPFLVAAAVQVTAVAFFARPLTRLCRSASGRDA